MAKSSSKKTFENQDWYDVPLYYDIIFDEDTKLEADFLETMVERYCQTDAKKAAGSTNPSLDWLEPACGSGRLMIELQHRGHRTYGFDLSLPMLKFAKEVASNAVKNGVLRADSKPVFFQGDMTAFKWPESVGQKKVDMAFCMVSTFKYLLEEQAALAHLSQMARALKIGGCYVLGFHLTQYEFLEEDLEEYEQTRGDIHVNCTIKGFLPKPEIRREKVRSRLVVTDLTGKQKQKCYETTWQFRTYSQEEFLALLAKVPALEMVGTYGFQCDPNQPLAFGEEQLDQIVILRKKSN